MQKNFKIKSIKGFNCFSLLFQVGEKFKNYPALASVCYNIEKAGLNELWLKRYLEQTDTLFIGVAVSKRTCKKAVNRNRIKRLLRESIRLSVNQIIAKGESINFSTLIISWKEAIQKPSEINLHRVLPFVEDIINKANEKL